MVIYGSFDHSQSGYCSSPITMGNLFCSTISARKLRKLPKGKLTVPSGALETTTKGMINMGTNFNDLWNDSSFISEEQRNKIDFEVALIGKLIEARESKGLSQKQLADMCGLKQSAIARLEKMNVTPQLNTLIKVLKPLGYRLDIVPCD
nr:MAG TPA: helix-turn-helix domain protein [Caudoviricetes sp.]